MEEYGATEGIAGLTIVEADMAAPASQVGQPRIPTKLAGDFRPDVAPQAGLMRHQYRNRHAAQHITGNSPQDQLPNACMAVHALVNQIARSLSRAG